MIALAYILYENIAVLLPFTILLAIPCKYMTWMPTVYLNFIGFTK